MAHIPHYSSQGEEHAVPEVAVECSFLIKDGSDVIAMVLAVKGRNSRAVLVDPVLCEGRTFEDTVDQGGWSES
eukprot:1408471-Alexandrium_andersonii.AAC.1